MAKPECYLKWKGSIGEEGKRSSPIKETFLPANLDSGVLSSFSAISPLSENLLLQVVKVDRVSLIAKDKQNCAEMPSAVNASSFDGTGSVLSRDNVEYLNRAKAINLLELKRKQFVSEGRIREFEAIFRPILSARKNTSQRARQMMRDTGLGSVVCTDEVGPVFLHEDMIFGQRVLGGSAVIATDYENKSYREKLIYWGMLPLLIHSGDLGKIGLYDWIYIPGIHKIVKDGKISVDALVINAGGRRSINLKLENLSQRDRENILAGCAIHVL